MRSDIGPGAVFPDYELPDHTGKPRRLSEIQAGDDPSWVSPRPSRGAGAAWSKGDMPWRKSMRRLG